MNLLVFAFSLGHSKHIEDEPFIRSTGNKFYPQIMLFTKYLDLYNN